MATINRVEFEGRVLGLDRRGDVDMRPEVGMTVHVFYDTTGDNTVEKCFPLVVPAPDAELTTEQRRAVNRISGFDNPADVIGDGVVTVVRYLPGRSGKLYPLVTVEIA